MTKPSFPATKASSWPPATSPYAVSRAVTSEYGYLSYWAKKFASALAPPQLAKLYLPLELKQLTAPKKLPKYSKPWPASG